jgi:hypothetical protein
MSQSLLATFRPKRYYTIPRESLESALEDVEQLINFFVIELQRILFAENVLVTFAVRLPRLSVSPANISRPSSPLSLATSLLSSRPFGDCA